jgi:hypothetical protein
MPRRPMVTASGHATCPPANYALPHTKPASMHLESGTPSRAPAGVQENKPRAYHTALRRLAARGLKPPLMTRLQAVWPATKGGQTATDRSAHTKADIGAIVTLSSSGESRFYQLLFAPQIGARLKNFFLKKHPNSAPASMTIF